MKFHVNCSMPRCGSELFQCLVNQHPEVYGSITSPLHGFWHGANSTRHNPETAAHGIPKVQQAMAQGLKGFTEAWYKEYTDKKVIVDKSRAWWDKMDLVWTIYPEAQMFCMYREADQIIESLEKLYKKDPMHPDFQGIPLHPDKRKEYWLNRAPLQQAIGGFEYRKKNPDSRCLMIQMDALVEQPVDTMKQVFEKMGVSEFEIDPKKVEKPFDEVPGVFGPLGNHDVRPIVQKLE